MRLASVDEVKKIQVEILDRVDEFCRANNINYWIDSGTLLGAIRHQGYIPWDDDIDVGMLRTDYERFMQSFNECNSRYSFKCAENDKNWVFPYGKVIDNNTVLYEPNEKGFKTKINIDIFPYDNAPDDNRTLTKMYNYRDILWKLTILKTNKEHPSGNFVRRALVYCLRVFFSFISMSKIITKMCVNAKRYNKVSTKRVGNFSAYTRMSCDKHVFNSFIDVEFEGKRYKAPIGYDEWLKSFYGDYMILPPEDQRYSHHQFVAYINN